MSKEVMTDHLNEKQMNMCKELKALEKMAELSLLDLIKQYFAYYTSDSIGMATLTLKKIKALLENIGITEDFISKNKEEIQIMLSSYNVSPNGRGGFTCTPADDGCCDYCCEGECGPGLCLFCFVCVLATSDACCGTDLINLFQEESTWVWILRFCCCIDCNPPASNSCSDIGGCSCCWGCTLCDLLCGWLNKDVCPLFNTFSKTLSGFLHC